MGQWFATVCAVLMSVSDVFLQSGVGVLFARESSPRTGIWTYLPGCLQQKLRLWVPLNLLAR